MKKKKKLPDFNFNNFRIKEEDIPDMSPFALAKPISRGSGRKKDISFTLNVKILPLNAPKPKRDK